METIVAAAITGAVTLIGVIIANNKTSAVMNAKLEDLTREVREHNNFARRMPAVEQHLEDIDRRIDNLEDFHKPT